MKPKLVFENFGVLPGKPSALLKIALADLRKVEKSKKYKVDMQQWHEPALSWKKDQSCSVCLAGAVMAKTLKVPFKTSLTPSLYPQEHHALVALDALREGNFGWAFDCLAITYYSDELKKELMDIRHLGSYKYNPTQFKKNMIKMAKILEEHGY